MKFLYIIILLVISTTQSFAFELSSISNYEGVALKQLVKSDLPNRKYSNTREIKSVKEFSNILGDCNPKQKFDTNVIYYGDNLKKETIKTTWYPWYANRKNRKHYCVLYYQKNEIMNNAKTGDILLIGTKKNKNIDLVIFSGNRDKNNLLNYLGMENLKDINKAEEKNEETNIKVQKDKKSKKLIIIGKVSKIYDGDTFILDNLFKVRMVGIDTPEKKQVCQDKRGRDFMCGEKSKKHLEKLLGKRKLSCEMHGWGAYNRHLFICKNSKGVDVNRQMVADGYAVMSTYKPFRYAEEEKQAKENNIGLWSGEFKHPSQWRKEKRQKKKSGR
jgi:endonuclease YncB( thermonuclease family)